MSRAVYERQLQKVQGQKGASDDHLPMAKNKKQFLDLVNQFARVGVRAPPGCGKTMLLPEWLYHWEQNSRFAVLLVQPTTLACRRLVDSFVHFRGWHRTMIHLKTGDDFTDEFMPGWTRVTIVTYGILWQWISGDENTRENMFLRYNCFVLDEFATGPPSKHCTRRLPPDVEEIASVLSCLVGRKSWRYARLIVTSAALDPNHVRATLQETNIGLFQSKQDGLICSVSSQRHSTLRTFCRLSQNVFYKL